MKIDKENFYKWDVYFEISEDNCNDDAYNTTMDSIFNTGRCDELVNEINKELVEDEDFDYYNFLLDEIIESKYEPYSTYIVITPDVLK